MSENFAMQPDEFESTNERLDSILDRLNALGQSASEMKVAPLGSTQGAAAAAVAVAQPDLLPPAIPAAADLAAAPAAITFDEFTAPTVPDMPDTAALLESDTAELVEPTVSETNTEPAPVVEQVVEPVETAEPDAPVSIETPTELDQIVHEEIVHKDVLQGDAIQDQDEALEDLTTDEVFGSLDTVELNDPIESVETISPELAPEPAADEPVAPEVEPVAELATSVFVDQEVHTELAPEPVTPEPVADEPVAELATSVFVDQEVHTELAPEPVTAEVEPVAPQPEVVEHAVATPSVFDAEPAVDASAIEPEALLAELAFETEPTEPAFDTDHSFEAEPIIDADNAGSVFDTEADIAPSDDSALAAAIGSPSNVPDAPTSIFGSGLGRSTEPEAPTASEGENEGWVSFHDAPPPSVPEAPAVVEAPVAASSAFGKGAFDAQPVIADQPLSDAEMFNLDNFSTDPAFDQAPMVDPTHAADPVGVATEVEQTLSEIDPMSGMDTLASFDTAAPPAIQDPSLQTPLADGLGTIEEPIVESEHYATDEDLPLPDFTGVYGDETESLLDEDGMPVPVEKTKSSKFAARREELDKLRPSDEEQGAEMAEAEKSRGLGFKKQIALVAIFAIAVLVFFWLQDPAAVEDIRSGVDDVANN